MIDIESTSNPSMSSAVNLPLVSIVINNFNYADYLGEAIESALSQDYDNCEVIVVDDGSTDRSREVIDEFATRVSTIFKPNGGQASAFNAGIAAAEGEFIVLLDSDDVLSPEAVAECVKAFPRGYSRVYFRLQNVDSAGRILDLVTPINDFRTMDGYPTDHAEPDSNIYWGPPTSGNFFNASLLKKILPIPERTYRLCADAFVVAKTSMYGPVLSLDKSLGAYRLHGQNAFFSTDSDFSNPKRMNTRIRHYFTTTALTEDVCRARGIPRKSEAAEHTFWFIHLLTAGWVSDFARRG